MPPNFFKQLPDTDEKAAAVKKKAVDPRVKYEQLCLELDIFDSSAYAVLDDKAQATVYNYVRHQNPLTNVRPAFQYEALVKKRETIAKSVARHDMRLDKMNPAAFKYLTDEDKTALAQELYFAFYLFSAQYDLDAKEDRWQNQNRRLVQITKCASLLNALRDTLDIHNPDLERKRVSALSEQPVKYLGLTIVAPVLTEIILGYTTGDGIELMRNINGGRLYWVWAKSLVSSVLGYLCATAAQDALAIPQPFTGGLSWSLYYAWFGVNLYLFTKQSLPSENMTQEEADNTASLRFWTQWKQRKFRLLNDSIWGTANLASFFWLVGSGTLGFYGDLLTAILLVMDIGMSLWAWWEAETEHHASLSRYVRDIGKLNQKISPDYPEQALVDRAYEEALDAKISNEIRDLEALPVKTAKDESDLFVLIEEQSRRRVLIKQRDQLVKAKTQEERDWQYKTEALLYDFIYAFALLVAFVAMCFLPFAAPAVASLVVIIGAAMCFTFTSVYTGMSATLETKKIQDSTDDNKTEYRRILAEFKQLKMTCESTADVAHKQRLENQMRQLYLDMRYLRAETKHQAALIAYQKKQLLYSTLISVIIPPIVLVVLLLGPFGMNLLVVAAIFVIVKLINQYMLGDAPSKKSWRADYAIELCPAGGRPAVQSMQENCLYLYREQATYTFYVMPPTESIKNGLLQRDPPAAAPNDTLYAGLESNRLYIHISEDGSVLNYTVKHADGSMTTDTIKAINLLIDKFTEDNVQTEPVHSAILGITTQRAHTTSQNVYCVSKHAEAFKIEDLFLRNQAPVIKGLFDAPNAKISQDQRELILDIASHKGYRFDLPYFDEKKYLAFRESPGPRRRPSVFSPASPEVVVSIPPPGGAIHNI